MKLITSIHKLTLEKFIEAICDNDLSVLIIEGEPTEEELKTTWADLLEQYTDALNNDSNLHYVQTCVEYKRAKNKHDIANLLIEVLAFAYVPKWGKELNRLTGSSFDFEKELEKGKDKYNELLKRCYNRNKSNLIRYQLAQRKLEEMQKVQVEKPQRAYDRGYFTKVMVNLKDYKGREIPYTVSVYEFCVLVNGYQEYASYLKTQKRT